jgi:hypothetical protein
MSEHLNNAKLQLFHRLYEQVNSAAERAITFYTKEAGRLKLEWRDSAWHHGDITSISYMGDGVTIKWDEYRRSCHVDGGNFTLPWEALADDTYQSYITDLVAAESTKKQIEFEAEKARQLAYKRSQLAQLKTELGEQ